MCFNCVYLLGRKHKEGDNPSALDGRLSQTTYIGALLTALLIVRALAWIRRSCPPLTEHVEVGVEGRHDVARVRLDAHAGEARHLARVRVGLGLGLGLG